MIRLLLAVALCLATLPAFADPDGEEPAVQASSLVRAHLERSRQLEEAGQSEAAGAELEKVLQLTGNLPAAHFQRAELFVKQGDTAAAIDAYTHAIEAIALQQYLE
ncbi:MAG: hypothetical protein COW73_07210 [Nitrospirae bacterium CG18_big_fil_WC_8_21_14_2_50_70_55]|nr:hypothetical protein [Deltaproteobacteria bacterium]OIP65604.1 MAG: hypothetical protein AUK30_04500 [Nitrospirae bacterium CG2_30_70_394]PIQ04758.1 MAG: hypothetical protein COW73_07210 [Nitrospirae bacterium CG18_big_fil_WC_8_21_14_2_50_70_55]PIU78198.1 MAG: hypothetical protein COS73_07800 [Nitrospirae bacterium CG06_land_8_20_14_3_00_70_43]PIW82203.1 MAG: hypothetical protein COZ96_09750 [Nitrospirae bacterium CG_4_8_14_3_um_filter_70_85]PIX83233.1 MAG: hypothetical protein COZ33_06395 